MESQIDGSDELSDLIDALNLSSLNQGGPRGRRGTDGVDKNCNMPHIASGYDLSTTGGKVGLACKFRFVWSLKSLWRLGFTVADG